jgi:serine/threonine-protein kinase RsbW
MTEPLNEAACSFCIHRLEEMSSARRWLKEALAARCYGRHDTFAVRLAFEEAVANGVTHGNNGDPTKTVTVNLVVDEARVQITVCDEGPGFDYSHVDDPRADRNILKESGRGVMLIRCFMDDISYNGPGNCVRLVKYRSGTAPS